MNKKAILFLVIGILGGAATVYLLPKGKPAGEPTAENTASEAANPTATELRPAATDKPAVENVAVRPATKAPAPLSAWAKLSEKYGAEKTALSSKITSNLTSVISDGMKLAETAARSSGATNISAAAARDMVRRATGELGLTDEQKEKATAILESSVAKRMSAVTDLAAAMETEPENMMELFLAGDALARKEISQAEYDRITQPTRNMLQNLGGFIGGGGGGGGAQAFTDEETTSALNAILTPDQQTKLAEMTARLAERATARAAQQNNSGLGAFQPGQIPVLELDKLDQSVASVRQMTEAARMMMEAMKGLKAANPGTVNQ